jgi:ERCC4-type nuclease
MIHIDRREGGPNQATELSTLSQLFSTHRFHPPTSITTLPAADFYFNGNGPHGPISVGLERKRIPDFFQSLHSGRLVGEQLPKLIDLYDHCYLVLEGQARVDWATGELEESWGGQWRKVGSNHRAKGRAVYTGEAMLGAMATISTFTPVKVLRTFGQRDTVDVVATMWHWWSKKWTDHKSHRAIYTPQTTVSIGKASTVRRVAAQLKSVGWERSGVVEQRFRSVEEMTAAGPGDWAKLPGFGKVLSERVVRELKGEQE